MLVGALRDHDLVKGTSDFKDDVHVRRGMKKLGLTRSDSSEEVLAAGRELFGQDSWAVDLVLYRLGKENLCTKAHIQRIHRERIIEKRDQKVRQAWASRKALWGSVIRSAMVATRNTLTDPRWNVKPSHDETSTGFLLSQRRGLLSSQFREGGLYIWTGLELNVSHASIDLYSGFEFEADGRLARTRRFRDELVKGRYDAEYEDTSGGWEKHYRTLGSFGYGRNPEAVKKQVVKASVDASLKAQSLLKATARS
jgi:hypothetical protein